MADLSLDINVRLNIDRSTAEACLKIVETYMNDHSNLDIVCNRCDDGTLKYTFVNKWAEGGDNT